MTFEIPRGADKGRVVLRGDTGYWLTGAVTVIFLLFLVSAAFQGGLEFTVRALPWALFVVWVLYLVLIRPSVVLMPGSLEIVNIFRRYTIAWSAVASLTTKYQLVVQVKSGRRITSWGASAPLPRRSQVTAFERIARTRPKPAAPKPHVVVRSVMLGWQNPTGRDVPDVVGAWDWRGILPLLGLAVLCAVDVAVGSLVG